MNVTKVKLSKLHEAKQNVRIHSQRQIDEMKRSLEKFGQFRAIVCDENFEILVGNGLFAAMKQAGYEEADCYVRNGLSAKEKKKLMLADNKIFSLGVDDLNAFEDIVRELEHDFDIPGYDDELLKTMTYDISEADDFMADYGKLDISTRAGMAKAADHYVREDIKFAEDAEEIKPVAEETQFQRLPTPDTNTGDINTSPAETTSQNRQKEGFEKRFVVCPKCGERIWL